MSQNIHFATLLNTIMRDLRHRYTYSQRDEFQQTIKSERQYIYPLLMDKQNGHCASCPNTSGPFDIDHKVYNPMLTINELQLLCWPCHKGKTNFTPFRNRGAVMGRPI